MYIFILTTIYRGVLYYTIYRCLICMSLYSQLRMHVFSRVIVRLCMYGFHMHSQARTCSLPSSPLTVTRGPRFSRTVIWILSEPMRFTIPVTKRIVYVITHTIIHTFYESYNSRLTHVGILVSIPKLCLVFWAQHTYRAPDFN